MRTLTKEKMHLLKTLELIANVVEADDKALLNSDSRFEAAKKRFVEGVKGKMYAYDELRVYGEDYYDELFERKIADDTALLGSVPEKYLSASEDKKAVALGCCDLATKRSLEKFYSEKIEKLEAAADEVLRNNESANEKLSNAFPINDIVGDIVYGAEFTDGVLRIGVGDKYICAEKTDVVEWEEKDIFFRSSDTPFDNVFLAAAEVYREGDKNNVHLLFEEVDVAQTSVFRCLTFNCEDVRIVAARG